MSERCPICGLDCPVGRSTGADRKQFDCSKCGHYEVSGTVIGMIKNRVSDRRVRARLSHAVRRRAAGENWPYVDSYHLDELAAEPLPKPERQILLLLKWIADQADDDRFHSVEIEDETFTGVIGAVDADGVYAILSEAMDSKLIEPVPDDEYRLTIRGWRLVEDAQDAEEQAMAKSGGKVFIGHGRSRIWRDLKDYLHDRLGLDWDEFNRESAAGLSTTERLQTMIDNASFAFIVMTAEDETASGEMNPRMNVVHEAGLFQGALGFKKAIILLEEGCQEFSNVIGLGQIRFPTDNLAPKLDEIRQVLEREGIVKS
ncbi:hypothetical protein EXZ48_32430 [Shinella sp. JR1-6]|nr:hypothetical protein EXZ48_32430 [Shinella sp. JR1-6]